MESQFRDFDHEEVLFLAFLQLNVNFMDTWITFFIITNQQNILAQFIILIINRFFPLVSRRQRFFYTVCYKLRSRKMRIRYLVFPIPLFFSFLLSFSFFSSSIFSFFLLLLHGLLQALVLEDENQVALFSPLFLFVVFYFFPLLSFLLHGLLQATVPGDENQVALFSCLLFFFQFSSLPYIWFSSLLHFPPS